MARACARKRRGAHTPNAGADYAFHQRCDEIRKLSQDSAVNATAAPTDLGVLVRALASGELLEDLRSFEPLAPAFVRGIEARNQLLNEHGGTLTAEGVAG